MVEDVIAGGLLEEDEIAELRDMLKRVERKVVAEAYHAIKQGCSMFGARVFVKPRERIVVDSAFWTGIKFDRRPGAVNWRGA
jgi:hypothetical protein